MLPINNFVSNHVKGVRVRQWGIYTVILFLCRQMELTWYCSLFSVLWSPDGLHNLLSLSSGEVPTLAPVNWVHRTRETRNDAAINEGTTLVTVALKTLEPQHEEAETNSPYLGNMKEKEKKTNFKEAFSVLMLCTPVFIFTSGSSALLGHPCCGLSIWLSLLAIFNTLFWVYVNLFHEKMDKTCKYDMKMAADGY